MGCFTSSAASSPSPSSAPNREPAPPNPLSRSEPIASALTPPWLKRWASRYSVLLRMVCLNGLLSGSGFGFCSSVLALRAHSGRGGRPPFPLATFSVTKTLLTSSLLPSPPLFVVLSRGWVKMDVACTSDPDMQAGEYSPPVPPTGKHPSPPSPPPPFPTLLPSLGRAAAHQALHHLHLRQGRRRKHSQTSATGACMLGKAGSTLCRGGSRTRRGDGGSEGG